MKGKVLFDAFGYIDDRYLDIADAPRKELIKMKYENGHTIKRKTFTVLLAAAICVSLLAITAVAEGWIPGIFKTLQEEYPAEQNLFEAAADANSEAVPESVDIPQLDYSSFTLFERYYDGETILLGYDLDVILPEAAVCYDMDSVLLEKIKNGTAFSEISWEEEQAWDSLQDSENAMKYNLTGGARALDRMYQAALSPEAYEEAWRLLVENGYVCMVTYDAWIGDHILVNGADMMETIDPDNWTLRTEYETEEGECIKLNPLPEAGQNQESVTVTLNIKSCKMYWYMDLEGNAFYSSGDHETEVMDFLLENVS